MPDRIPAVCPKQPCRYARGACPDHPRKRRSLGSSSARGYGKAHRALREVVLREEPWCPGYPAGRHVDRECVGCRGSAIGCAIHRVRTSVLEHILSMRRGGAPLDRRNVRGMCASCNSRKAVTEEGARPS